MDKKKFNFLGNVWPDLGINSWKQTTNKSQTLKSNVMKTVKLNAFTNDKIQEKELNYLKGGSGNEPTDLLIPPRR